MRQKKAPGGVGASFQNTPCHGISEGCTVFISKQLHPAMTTSLYTKPIERRKPTAKISPKHCELATPKLVGLQERLNPSPECATSQLGLMYRGFNLVFSSKDGVYESRTEATMFVHVVVIALQVMLRPCFQKLQGKDREPVVRVSVRSRRANYV
jgi:hypothetical protein